jgi:glyoxylase-like metal-dependent hydrolase (beta-lactamase superfamily II)
MPWHSVTPISPDIFLISEPMGRVDPRIGVATCNMYLFVGRERAALVDSGMGIGDLRGVVLQLTDLPCTVLNTHSHWDHVGSNASFAETAIHQLEADKLGHEQRLGQFRQAFRCPADPAVLPPSFDVNAYHIVPPEATRTIRDGDQIDLGGRLIEAVHTPGHSPGHTAYLDRASGLVCTGDTAYEGPVFACFEGGDPLAFMRTASRLAALPGPLVVCPGHNAVIADPGWLPWYARCVEDAVTGRVEGDLRQGLVLGREVPFGDLSVWLPA